MEGENERTQKAKELEDLKREVTAAHCVAAKSQKELETAKIDLVRTFLSLCDATALFLPHLAVLSRTLTQRACVSVHRRRLALPDLRHPSKCPKLVGVWF